MQWIFQDISGTRTGEEDTLWPCAKTPRISWVVSFPCQSGANLKFILGILGHHGGLSSSPPLWLQYSPWLAATQSSCTCGLSQLCSQRCFSMAHYGEKQTTSKSKQIGAYDTLRGIVYAPAPFTSFFKFLLLGPKMYFWYSIWVIQYDSYYE